MSNRDLPTLGGIDRAARELSWFLAQTPLLRSETLSRNLGADVWFKNETVSPVASFKLRGAITELFRARDAGGLRGAVTSSSGNHGQGVAFAARLLGVSSDVFLPLGANPLKRARIESFGAQIHEAGADIDEAKAAAMEFAADRELNFVDDGEGLGIMEGGGTVGLEIARALDSVDVVFVPMGSGSLASGVGAAVKALHPSAEVVAVQAKGSPAMYESFHAGRAIERPIRTVADGLVCRVPAVRALAGLLEFVDDAVTVSDEELLAGVKTLALDAQVLTEPSGAATMAAAWKQRDRLTGKRVVLVLSGANITEELLQKALAGPALR